MPMQHDTRKEAEDMSYVRVIHLLKPIDCFRRKLGETYASETSSQIHLTPRYAWMKITVTLF